MARIKTFKEPKSSFMAVDKDLSLIADAILQNVRIKRLIYYDTSDALNRPNLSEEESAQLFGDRIKICPKMRISSEKKTYLYIGFDNFSTNLTNPQFRDNIITFDILCHLDLWELDNMQLRPFKIAAEIDEMFNNKHLTGIGTLEFLTANQILYNHEFVGLTLMYSAIHGEEDKNFNQDLRDLISQEDVERYKQDFKDTYDNGEWIID